MGLKEWLRNQHSGKFSGTCMGSNCCYLCFWNPLFLLQGCFGCCCCCGLKTRDPKFLVKDDLLEVETSISLGSPLSKDLPMSVKFNRTVNSPNVQTVTLTWTVEHKQEIGGGVSRISKETRTFDLKVQATIIELSNNKIVLKVEAFDEREKAYKLLLHSEYTLDESNQTILNKEKWSNFANILKDRESIGCCGDCFNYYEYDIVTEFGYNN